MEQHHWRTLRDNNYIGSWDFKDKEVKTVTITNVKRETIKDSQGRDGECTILYIKDYKPMVLNKTNGKIIEKVLQSPFIEDWIGKKINLEVQKVRFGRDLMDGIRVVSTKPELPELYPTHEKWLGAIESLKSGKVTIEQIKKNYKLSKQHENELISASTAV